MANTSELAFYAHLTNTESLDYIVREGFTLEIAREVIPTELGRKVTSWAIKYYFDSGRTVAPTGEAIMAAWGDQLVPLEIEIDFVNEVESVQWAIEQMRNDYADWTAGKFAMELSKDVRNADGPDRAGVVQEYSQKLHYIAQSLISRKNEMTGAEGLEDALKRYEERVKNAGNYAGITFGLKEIDDHWMGIHPGELAVVAATSGGGKSWFSIICLLQEYKNGRRCVLFTLENDVEMTFDRIACVNCHVPYEDFQRGVCEQVDIDRVKQFSKEMAESEHQPIIIQPDTSEASGQAMIRRAIIEEADSVIIDQLSHIEAVAGSKARQRNEIVAEIVKDLYKLINNYGSKIPLLLLHQINREGQKEARKNGRFLLEHLGEAKQVGDAADFVSAIYQSPDAEIAEEAEFQMLKGRRVKVRDWNLTWRPAIGDVRVKRGVDRAAV